MKPVALFVFFASLIALSSVSPANAQHMPLPLPTTADASQSEARPFPEQTGPPVQSGANEASSSTANRLGAEAFGGVVGTVLGGGVGAGVGLGMDYLLLRGYALGMFTTAGALVGALAGAGWGVNYGGNSMGRAALWWAPYAGAIVGWPVGSGLAAAYLTSQPSPGMTETITAFSLAALVPTLGAMAGFELTIAPTSLTSSNPLPAGFATNGGGRESGVLSPHMLEMRIRF
jgi:hypothetical protein